VKRQNRRRTRARRYESTGFKVRRSRFKVEGQKTEGGRGDVPSAESRVPSAQRRKADEGTKGRVQGATFKVRGSRFKAKGHKSYEGTRRVPRAECRAPKGERRTRGRRYGFKVQRSRFNVRGSRSQDRRRTRGRGECREPSAEWRVPSAERRKVDEGTKVRVQGSMFKVQGSRFRTVRKYEGTKGRVQRARFTKATRDAPLGGAARVRYPIGVAPSSCASRSRKSANARNPSKPLRYRFPARVRKSG
jgi:hypothetical protein